jgi:type I restriction enzyme S subunit
MTFDDGVQQTHLLNDPIRSCPVVLPSPFEQTAIADALTDIDSLTASLERLITKKKAIKQGMMQQLLTGKDRLPGFNKDWPRFRFDQLAEPVGDRTDPRGMPTSTRLVELEHIEPNGGRLLGSTMAHDAVSLKTVFQTGDVLFGKLRAYLRKYWLAEWSGICSTEIWALRATPETDSSYVRYLIETDRFIEVASGGYGTHMPRSDWSSLRGLTFDVPSHDEQEAIAAALRDVDAEIASLRHRLTKAKAVRQGMMQELLTGRTRLPVKEGAA